MKYIYFLFRKNGLITFGFIEQSLKVTVLFYSKDFYVIEIARAKKNDHVVPIPPNR